MNAIPSTSLGAVEKPVSAKVLVIDDDPRTRHLLDKMLKKDGAPPDTAGGGAEGLEKFDRGQYDVVITDRAMPDMRGDDIAVEIIRRRPGTPVILLTGYGQIMKDEGEMPPGVRVILSKPITPAELRRAIHQCLELTRSSMLSSRHDKGTGASAEGGLR